MIILSDEQLRDILATLQKHHPKSLLLEAMVRNRVNKTCWWPGTEFVVDRYPDYSVLMCRPIKDSTDYIPGPRNHTVNIFCRNPKQLDDFFRQEDFGDWRQRISFIGDVPRFFDVLYTAKRCVLLTFFRTIYTVPKDDVFPALARRSQELGCTDPAWRENDYGVAHLLDPARLAKTPIPEGFHLGEITEGHAEQINSEWHYGSPATLLYFQCLLRRKFPSSGVFTTDGRLVAYILYRVEGSMFNGYVQPEYRKKGLFQIVNYDLACKIVALGQPTPYCFVRPWNDASLNAYAKLGAVKVDPSEFALEFWTYSPKSEESS